MALEIFNQIYCVLPMYLKLEKKLPKNKKKTFLPVLGASERCNQIYIPRA